jgi:hypothetical protein
MGIYYVCQGHFLLFGRYDGNICLIAFNKKMTFRTFSNHLRCILEQISLISLKSKKFKDRIF